MKKRVLVADNNEAFLTSQADMLSDLGYHVLTANSPETALQVMQQTPVHVAVLDMRLSRDSDASDFSGIDVAENGDEIIDKIILTGYPTIDTMRRALAKAGRILPPASDYISKTDVDAGEKVINAVEQAFTNVNFELDIDMTGRVSLESIINGLRMPEAKELEKEILVEQLEELFRRLFPRDISQIVVSPMQQGRSGGSVLKVRPYYKGKGYGEYRIIKLGARRTILIEADNYDKFVAPFTGNRATKKAGLAETLHLAAILYSFVGDSPGGSEEITDFHTLCKRQKLAPKIIVEILQDLFNETCELWYTGERNKSGCSVANLYLKHYFPIGVDFEDLLRKGIQEIVVSGRSVGGSVIFRNDENRIAIRFPDGESVTFPDPAHALINHELEFSTEVDVCITHGDLHTKNILVDRHHQTWLIDFYRTGMGHMLRDFAQLEGAIKYSLLETDNLRALYEFERSLILQPSFAQKPRLISSFSQIAELQSIFEIICSLRGMAHARLERHDLRDYNLALFFNALKVSTIRALSSNERGRRAAIRRRHALISAGLLAENILN